MTLCKYCHNEVAMVDIQPTVDSAGRQYRKGICPQCNRVNLLPNIPAEELTEVSMGDVVNEPEHTPIDTPIDTDMPDVSEDVSMNDDPDTMDTPIDTDIDTDMPDVSEDVSMNDDPDTMDTPIDTDIDTDTEVENPPEEDTPNLEIEEISEDSLDDSEEGNKATLLPLMVLIAIMIFATVISLFLAQSEG